MTNGDRSDEAASSAGYNRGVDPRSGAVGRVVHTPDPQVAQRHGDRDYDGRLARFIFAMRSVDDYPPLPAAVVRRSNSETGH